MAAQGSALTNKYAEGYPGKRYYGGCEFVDVVETLARDRLKALYGADHANVQPHSGAQANMAVFLAALQPGDTILGLDLAHGGHLTHGMKLNFSGKYFKVASYGVTRDTHRIDFDQLASQAREHKPKLVIAGASAYPRLIDFAKFADVCREVGAMLMVDMAHISGLVAAKLHPNPVPYAEFVTSTTHKTLRGPRSGFILCRPEWAQKVDSGVFPGIQGGPLMHVVAAKAVAFREAAQPAFRQYISQVLANAQALADELLRAGFPHRVRRHRQPPAAGGRVPPGRGRRQAGRTRPGRGRHHGQQEHDPLRPSQADGPVRHPPGHPGPDHPRHEGSRDAAGGPVDRRRADGPGRRGRDGQGAGRRRGVVRPAPGPVGARVKGKGKREKPGSVTPQGFAASVPLAPFPFYLFPHTQGGGPCRGCSSWPVASS